MFGTYGCAVDLAAIGGTVPGLDGTPRAGEHYSANLLLRAASMAGVSLLLIIDNLGVCNGVRNCIRGALPHGHFNSAFWQQTFDLCNGALKHQCEWVPSHGKYLDWQPPHPHSAEEWRHLNKLADQQATYAQVREGFRRNPYINCARDAAMWSTKALFNLKSASRRLLHSFNMDKTEYSHLSRAAKRRVGFGWQPPEPLPAVGYIDPEEAALASEGDDSLAKDEELPPLPADDDDDDFSSDSVTSDEFLEDKVNKPAGRTQGAVADCTSR